jgi:hypothetical protein
MMPLAQVNEAITAGTEIVKTSSQLGSDVFLTCIILLIIGILGGMHVWFVSIPNGKSHRQNSERLSEAIQAMSGTSSDTLDHTKDIKVNAQLVKMQVDRMVGCKTLEVRVIQKIADACNVDVAEELAEIRGRLS